MAHRTLTGTLYDPVGDEPLPFVRLVIVLEAYIINDVASYPRQRDEVVTDANGDFSIDIATPETGAGTAHYRFGLPDRAGGVAEWVDAYIEQEDGSDITLETILDDGTDPIPNPAALVVRVAALEAGLDAEEAARIAADSALDGRLDVVEGIVAGLNGGADVDNATLIEWVSAIQITSVTSWWPGWADIIPWTAVALWPDGVAGSWITTAVDDELAVPTSWTISHAASGKTVTQPAITYNDNGVATVVPAMTVA